MVKKINYIFLCFFCSIILTAQSNQKIEQKNDELSKIKEDISNLESELNDLSQQEKESLTTLDKIEKQKLLLGKVIAGLTRQERQKKNRINNYNNEIQNIEKEIDELKKEYSEYIVWVYKNGKAGELKYLLTAGNVNQALIRYKYLSYITKQNEKNVNVLNENINSLQQLKEKLKTEVAELEVLEKEKADEQNKLDKRKNEKEELVTALRKNSALIEKEIDEKRLAEIQIKNLITKLIEEERERLKKLREEKLKNENVSTVPDYNYDSFENFAQLKGKLNWPALNGNIIRKFGENTNAQLKTVTLNYGIDLKTPKGGNVYAVAEGIVSAIEWIPGYGSVVIVTHKNNYRTVYGHLDNIKVNEGAKVTGGDIIGNVNESLEGSVMHFEIWNERNYQNPEEWLVKK